MTNLRSNHKASPKTNAMHKSAEYISILKTICSGQLDLAWNMIESSVTLDQTNRAVLQSTIEFQRGNVLAPNRALFLIQIFWHLLTTPGPGSLLIQGVFNLFFSILHLTPFHTFAFKQSYERYFSKMIHYRYSDFKSGFTYSYFLSNLAPRSGNTESLYLEGMLGHFYGMSGRFDKSLPILRNCLHDLHLMVLETEDDDFRFYTMHLEIEISAIYALHLSYAGHFDEATNQFEQAIQLIETTPYWWFELFTRSMRQYHCVETLNSTMLQEDTVVLKRKIGSAAFLSKYGLRTIASSALLAAIYGKMRAARIMSMNGKGIYSNSNVVVEIGRYHFLTALTHLEFDDMESAMVHAHLAEKSFTEIPGGRFHSADALLLAAEIQMRAFVATKRTPNKVRLNHLYGKVSRITNNVRGSIAIQSRAKFLMALIRSELESLDRPHITTEKNPISFDQMSARVRHSFSKILDLKQSETEAQSLVQVFDVQKVSLEILEEALETMNQNNFSQAIAEFFESTLGASHVEFKVARNSSKILTPSIQSQAGGLKISVPIKSDSMEFEISHPLVDIDFDPTSTRLVFFGSRLLQLLETQRNSERDAAIAQTTQMLAHDVRKPFSLLKVGLNMISNAKDETSIRTILARMIPEIDKSIKSVDGMITDVMEIGSTSTAMITEPACVKTLIQSIWSDTMRFHPNAQIQWRDSYQHTNLVPIHSQKISRVFANIFENALQSMHSNGTVWVKTQQFHDMIEICIGNSGSVISPENLSKIFDAFYTHGKKGGTGLGLAIAKKIISAHGGTIWCESAKSLEFPEGQVEFFFTLPLTQEPS